MKRVSAPLSASAKDRVRWQPLGLGVLSAGAPIGISVLHPLVGVALMIVELSMIAIIIATALFGTKELSDRAFRLLRMLGNRPEPASPQKPDEPGRSSSAPDGTTQTTERASSEKPAGLSA